MTNKVRYNGDNSRRGLSPALWGDQAKVVADQDLGKCVFQFEDFRGWSTHTVNTNAVIQGSAASWKVIASDGVLINPPATVDLATGESGVLTISGADADNDELYLCNPYEWLKLDDSVPNRIKLECRMRKDVLTDATSSFSFGLTKVSDAVAAMLTDGTGVLEANVDFVGFQQLTDDGDAIDLVYQATGQTLNTLLANAGTMTANTFIKLGLEYNPTPGDLNCLKFYIDGVHVNRVANTVSAADIAAATFPDAVAVVPVFGFIMNGTGDASYPALDWIAAGQWFEN